MDEVKGHAAFAAVWDWATKHEPRAERRLRREATRKVAGRVLELGAGVGANWPYLPGDIDYIGIEPDPHMLERARKRAVSLGREFALEPARAEQLPFDGKTFDTVLVTLTLCSVQDPTKALSEAYRVLKPGGALVFVEHVRPEGWLSGRLADAITPAWRRVAGGCHPNRRTGLTIVAAGLEIQEMTRQRVNGLPMIAGTALKPLLGPAEAAAGISGK
ncbi:MAG: class I SAM-dependent methyltransferase [Anaerolineaceae bacterium]